MSASVISPINKERRKPNCETVKKEKVKRLLGRLELKATAKRGKKMNGMLILIEKENVSSAMLSDDS
jgi:hypothetical protein